MSSLFALVAHAWRYRWEISAVIKVLAAMRKTAEQLTREYIRKRIQQKLLRQVIIVSLEIILLGVALFWSGRSQSLVSQLVASSVLWGITVYNLFELIFRTLPELLQVRRFLKGKAGYAMKYVLKISLVAELMQGNLLFLAVSLIMGISSRTFLGASVSYIEPWSRALQLIVDG